jgi:ABC transporter substrate binding protein
LRLIALTVTLTVSFMLGVFGAESQPARKIPRIGYLVIAPLADPPSAERRAFLEGLRDLGHVEGQNLIVEYRSAKWNRDLLPDLAEELVALKVDVIVAVPGSADAARQATTTVPIVILGGADPVAAGLVTNLAHPGGNITGTTVGLPEVAGKRLALLKEAVPKMSGVTVLWNSATELGVQQETQAAGRRLGDRAAIARGKRSEGLSDRVLRDDPAASRRANRGLVSSYKRVSSDHHRLRREESPADDVRVASGRGGRGPHVVFAERG